MYKDNVGPLFIDNILACILQYFMAGEQLASVYVFDGAGAERREE